MVKTNQVKEESKKAMVVKSAAKSPKATKEKETKKTIKKTSPVKSKEVKVKTRAPEVTEAAPKAKLPVSKTKLKGSSVELPQPKQEIKVVTAVLAQPAVLEPLSKILTYSLKEESETKEPAIFFDRIVPNEEIVKSLNKANYKQTNKNVQKILQAILRSSDVLVYMADFNSSFLLSGISVASKVLSGALTRIEAKQPVALVLAQNEDKLKELFAQTHKVFSSLDMHFAILDSQSSDEDKKNVLEKHMDVLYATVETLHKAKSSLGLNLNSVGFCFAYDLQDITHFDMPSFTEILKALPQERVQKVFIAKENTPKNREIAFTYLEDVESFYLLPTYVRDRSPKQFAHALTTTQKFQVLLGHIKHHKPLCAAVFANTRTVAEWIAYKLFKNGVKVELITSNLNFAKKQQLLKSIHNGETNIVVTTDYHISNLGLENLNCLYQFDLPDSGEKFIDRLNLIEKSKSPISVSFICEDYGYNMGKIEEKLGFKIAVVNPDKEYFNIKDASDYPLEADGRVKTIGQNYSTPQVAIPMVNAPKPAAVFAHTERQPFVQAPIQTPRMQPRPISHAPQETFVPKAEFSKQQAPKFENKFNDRVEKPQHKYQDNKFVRRDEKAKEAIDAARFAAQEKRKSSSTNKGQKEKNNKNILSLAVYIMQDAFKAATTAAKQSLASNIEENLPILTNVLNKVPFLKRSK